MARKQYASVKQAGVEKGSRLSFVSWTKPNLPYYCMEPWMSPPNASENKTMEFVSPGAREEFSIEIELA